MLLKQIKYFVTVVDCNSFTEAAEQCFISQSAISQQIRVLERELGVELIQRENRHFQITPAGEYFYRHGKDILKDAEELVNETIKIGKDNELQLRIGYLQYYNGVELHQAVADFSRTYPEVSIQIVSGTHEELYHMLRSEEIDIALSDQRRAFSEEYVNHQLLMGNCYAEISSRNKLSDQEKLTVEDLKRTPCILVSSKEQRFNEQEFYQNTLNFGDNFLFAENLEEARLMVVGNQGFLPIEEIGTLPPVGESIKRLPVYRKGKQLKRNYCAFWKIEKANYYIEEFAEILHKLLMAEE
ncbi:MAG: LysR family transcriptional regulator [Eubacteriales bacterium]|nr:LysR family transcriptional regulator [Eubacteriales bacterium]